jgi:hypothetical protein
LDNLSAEGLADIYSITVFWVFENGLRIYKAYSILSTTEKDYHTFTLSNQPDSYQASTWQTPFKTTLS